MIERNMVSNLDEKLQPDWGKIQGGALYSLRSGILIGKINFRILQRY